MIYLANKKRGIIMNNTNENAPIYLAIAYFVAFTIPGICQYF